MPQTLESAACLISGVQERIETGTPHI